MSSRRHSFIHWSSNRAGRGNHLHGGHTSEWRARTGRDSHRYHFDETLNNAIHGEQIF
mgnify:CR=1 FL=1